MQTKKRTPYKTRSCGEQLLARIRRHYRPGDRLPSEATLAREYKVSVGTIRQALDDLRKRGSIHTFARSGTFVSRGSGAARGNIGLLTAVLPELFVRMEWLRTFFVGMAAEAALRGRSLRTLPSGFDRQDVVRTLGSANLAELDALILLWVSAPDLLEPMHRHIPVVAIEFASSCDYISCVDYDQPGAVRQAVRHLADLGHERIGFLGPSHVLLQQTESYSPRYEEYIAALRHYGLPCNNAWTCNVIEAHDLRAALDRVLGEPRENRPTAILTQMATWLTIYELVRRGLVIGRDISIIGLEYLPSWQTWVAENRWMASQAIKGMVVEPGQIDPLDGPGRIVQGLVPTVTHLEVAELGRTAIREIERRWADPDARPRRINRPVQLHIGNTTGRAP